MSARRILHVIHGLTVGGAEIDLVRKAAWMTEHGECEVTICCLMRRGELAPDAEAAGVRVVGPLMRHRYDVTAAGRLREVFRSRDWSIVHAHVFAGNLVAWLVRAWDRDARRVPLVVSEHADASRWNAGIRFLQGRILRHAAVFQVPSEATRQSYTARGLPAERIRVMPNAIDIAPPAEPRDAVRRRMRRELGLADGTFAVGAVGRLQPIKGLEHLIDAVAGTDATLLLAGDGPTRAALEARAKERGVADRVRFLGTRSDVAALLVACDAFALHSYSESFAISVAEALRMEVPVVATNVGAIPEVTGDGRFARLVPPGDSGALAEAIRWTASHRDEAAAMARDGGAFVAERWSTPAVAAAQLRVYDELAGRAA